MKKWLATSIAALLLLLTACEGAPIQNQEQEQAIKTETTPPPTDENGDIVIRLATNDREYTPPEMRLAIEGFNALDNGYHVEQVVYSHDWLGSDDSGGLQTSDMRLQMDILQGKNVDMVADKSFAEMGRYEILTEKGAFLDLYSFLNSDMGANLSDLNEHILQIHETNNKLYQMPTYFGIKTIGGEAQYVGTKENWTLDDLMMHWEQMPDGSWFWTKPNRWSVYDVLIEGNLSAYVDYSNGTCSFDSPEFVRLLEFCMQFPLEREKAQPDWDTIYFLRPCEFSLFDGYHRNFENATGNNPFVIVGYPSEDENGSYVNSQGYRYSICAFAEPAVQEGAWAFISYMLEEEQQAVHDEDTDYLYGFPINNAAFQRKAEEELAHEGKTYVYEASGKKFTGGHMTLDEYEYLVDLINKLTRMERPVDKIAKQIIESEVKYYFEGDHTAEQTAQAIQGRIEIMLSERM